MPRTKTQARKSAVNVREASLANAISHLRTHPEATYRGVARLFDLNQGTLKNRFEGHTKVYQQAHGSQQKFDSEEEERIIQWVVELDDMGVPPRCRHVEEMMRAILARRSYTNDIHYQESGKHLIQ
ncbi:hypothetical protein HOY80DRAFT_1021194 [Tuber brumale]|nr:hypothetical protein HOY80DRAFT_1021194 [Tuber brumale]